MEHDALARDLAGHLFGPRVMVWQDIQLGASGSVRPDVYTIQKSYVRPAPMAYEVKVSRSDFLSDVTTGKWQAYLKYASGVVFGCEQGLLEKKDIPAHCGLMVRFPTGTWRLAKRPVLNPVEIPQNALIKLLIDGVEREGPRQRARQWGRTDAFMKKYGSEAARWVADAASVKDTVERTRERAAEIIAQAERTAKRHHEEQSALASPEWARLCIVLGLPTDANRYKVQDAISRVKVATEGGHDRRFVRQWREHMARMVQQADNLLAEDKAEEVA